MKRIITAALGAVMLCTVLVQPTSAAVDRYDKLITVTERVNGVDRVISRAEMPLGVPQAATSKWYGFGAKAAAGNRDYTFTVEYRHEVFFHWETVWQFNDHFRYRFSDGRNFVDSVTSHVWFDAKTTFWFPRNTPVYDNYDAGAGYVLWGQDWIDECLGGVKGIGCIRTMGEIIEVHIHDDGLGLWRFS